MRATLVVAVLALASPAAAKDEFQRLMDAMNMGEMVGILMEEGAVSSVALEESMFPGRGGVAWLEQVERIYEREVRESELRDDMRRLLGDTDLKPVLGFLESDVGQEIMALELTARRAFIDPEMEEVASEVFADADETHPVLLRQVTEFTEINDLVDQNVAGAFNSNASFALGAHDAGAFADLTVDQLIAEMWAGNEAVEADVSGWLYAYQMTAYSPLREEDFAAYIKLSDTDEGQALNAAIMGAFDELFADISYDVGFAAGRFMAQQDL